MEKKKPNSLKDNAARLQEIIKILSQHKITKGLDPVKFRLIIEDLGPTFIKIGQIMSMRSDILPEEYCHELTKLRKDVKPMSFAEVKDIILMEYNRSIADVFQTIDPVPLGSASIAQVHRATLKDGTDVVVKVQRTGIYDIMARDISLLKKAISILKVTNILGNVIDLNGVLDEIWYAAQEELNFTTESNHAIEFTEANQDIVYLATPRMFPKLTTSKILVMEYIGGVPINDLDHLRENGYDLDEIANKLADNYVKQVMYDGYFHADPHPDNIRIVEGKIVYLDFGMMGRLTKRDMDLLKRCMKGILKNDIHEVESVILTMGIHDNEIDHTALYSDIELVLNKYGSLEIGSMHLGEMFTEVFGIVSKHNISMPKNITMLMRGIIVMEGVLNVLSPSISFMQVLKNRMNGEVVQNVFSANTVKSIAKKGIAFEENLIEIPVGLNTLLKMAVKGEAKFNLELTDSQNKIGKLESMLNKIIIAVLDASLIVASSFICYSQVGPKTDNIPTLGLVFLIIAAAMSIWLVVKMCKEK